MMRMDRLRARSGIEEQLHLAVSHKKKHSPKLDIESKDSVA